MKTVPVIQLDLSPKEEAAFAVADNKTGELAEWDYSILKDILEELRSENLNMCDFGFSEAQLHALREPKCDFPWEKYQEEMAAMKVRTHVLIALKIPTNDAAAVKKAVARHAAQVGIKNNDKAIVAGTVLMALLGLGGGNGQTS